MNRLSFFSILITLVVAFEDKESLFKRLKFYNDVRKYSNNTIIMKYSPEQGLYTEANDYIENGNPYFKIPRKLTLCAYYLFPFKFEIISFLKQIKSIEETVGVRQKFSVFVLTYYILYLASDHRNEVLTYIKENNIEQYYNVEETEESLIDSFPKTIINKGIFEHDHFHLLGEYGLTGINELQELEEIYSQVLTLVKRSEHSKAMLPWVDDFEKFKWAYSVVTSRAIIIGYGMYTKLDNTYEKMKNFTKWEKMNNDLNLYFAGNVGANCIVTMVDLCNHYQPKMPDGRDKRTITLETINNYFINIADATHLRGEEVSNSYFSKPDNQLLFLHYGFTIPNNVFDYYDGRMWLGMDFSTSQLSLCKELGCIDGSVKKPSDITTPVQIIFYYGQFNNKLVNYGRVNNIKGNFEYKKYFKMLVNGQHISYENEISAWMFYTNTCKNFYKPRYDQYIRNINEVHELRNKRKNIEENWNDNDEERKEWISSKIYENINLISLYKLNILAKGIYGSYNNIIINTNNKLAGIRNRYLNQ